METTLEKTVIVWGQEDVLMKAVENLLITRHDWKVMRISHEMDEINLAQVMEDVTPDVLIVHEDVLHGDVHPLIKFVQDHSKLKIITIGLDNNTMGIYNKKTVCIKESSDLLAAIKNGITPDL